jgi:hypothetical protein
MVFPIIPPSATDQPIKVRSINQTPWEIALGLPGVFEIASGNPRKQTTFYD